MPQCAAEGCSEPRTSSGRCRRHRNAYMREYNKRPEVRMRRQARERRRLYGLSDDEYAALLEAQQGLCATCGLPDELVVDHDHETDEVRGLLCHRCNLALGLAGDSASTLLAMVSYLENRE